jgi:hypothetical protein
VRRQFEHSRDAGAFGQGRDRCLLELCTEADASVPGFACFAEEIDSAGVVSARVECAAELAQKLETLDVRAGQQLGRAFEKVRASRRVAALPARDARRSEAPTGVFRKSRRVAVAFEPERRCLLEMEADELVGGVALGEDWLL